MRPLLPYFISTNEIVSHAAATPVKILYIKMSQNWQRLYPRIGGYLKACNSDKKFRVTHHCICGSRIPRENVNFHFIEW